MKDGTQSEIVEDIHPAVALDEIEAPPSRAAILGDASFGSLAAVMLFAMMTLTFVDVIGRYFLSRPIFGAFELTELGLAIMVFAGLPLVTIRNEHVTTGLFDHLIKGGLRRFQVTSVEIFSLFAAGAMSWCCVLQARTAAALGETTQVLGIAKPAFIYFIAFASAVAALAHGYRAVTKLGMTTPWR